MIWHYLLLLLCLLMCSLPMHPDTTCIMFLQFRAQFHRNVALYSSSDMPSASRCCKMMDVVLLLYICTALSVSLLLFRSDSIERLFSSSSCPKQIVFQCEEYGHLGLSRTSCWSTVHASSGHCSSALSVFLVCAWEW